MTLFHVKHSARNLSHHVLLVALPADRDVPAPALDVLLLASQVAHAARGLGLGHLDRWVVVLGQWPQPHRLYARSM